MVDTLSERDSFTVLAFDTVVETPQQAERGLIPGSDRNRFRAVEFLAKIERRGGTELAAPLQQALTLLNGTDPSRDRILVLVTDGQVGNEDQILRVLGGSAQNVRIFTLGVDKAVNEAFLKRLALLGGGACEVVESEDRLDAVMERVHRRISTPVVSQLQLKAGALRIDEDSVVPARLPDLFAGAPVFVLGRYRRITEENGSIIVEGRDAAGRPWSQTLAGSRCANQAIPCVWARGRIRDLEDRLVLAAGTQRRELEHQIIQLSLEHNVLCRFTAYVAVDSVTANQTGQQQQMTQPVEMPEGWERKSLSANTLGAAPGALGRVCASAPSAPAGTPGTPARSRLLTGQIRSKGAAKSGTPLSLSRADENEVFKRTFEMPAMDDEGDDVTELVPESVARENQVVPLGTDANGALRVAMADPSDLETIDKLRFILNRNIAPVPTPPEEIQRAIDKNYGETQSGSVDSMLCEFTDTAIGFTESSYGLVDDDAPVTKLVNLMIVEAVTKRASAIYVQPEQNRLVVLYEINGVKVERDHPPRRLHGPIVRRIKIMAGLELAGGQREQRGRFSLALAGRNYEMAVHVTPGQHGEAIVLRFMSNTRIDDLAGFRRCVARILEESTAPEAGDELTRLGILTEQLAGLLEDLSSVGVPARAYRKLTALLGELRKVHANKVPASAQRLLSESASTLRAFSEDDGAA
jgi:hypothetical protein